jgi:branched-chain amino acid transport system substrate-binding protein
MAQVSYDKGLPHIAVGATKTTITDYGTNVFRVCYTDDFQGPVMAKFAYETLGLRNVAIMTDEKLPYSQYLTKTFKEYFTKLGGTIVAEASYESKQTTFTAQLSNLKSKNPEGIFLSGYFNEVGPIVRQAAQAGLTNVKYFGGDGWDSSEIIRSGGDAIVGGFFCNHYNENEDRAEVKNFLAEWTKKYNDKPGTTMGALGYDAAALMMDAIKRASTKDAKGIIAAIEDTSNFPGVSGTITLKGMAGNPAKPALVVEVTKSGFVPRKSFQYNEIYSIGT